MTSRTPYLSVVVTARNDNHGGNLLRRMQLFVNGLLAQCRRHALPAELILVEWNPHADRPRLRDALAWPRAAAACPVRIIEVPAALHRRYRHAQALPLYQMIGKNVGLRRARGEFVLATNIDILFSDALMAFLAAGRLDPRRMYRIDRQDVPADVPLEASLDEQLRYCREHILRVSQRHRTVCSDTPELAHIYRTFRATLQRQMQRLVGLLRPAADGGAPDGPAAAQLPLSALALTKVCNVIKLFARTQYEDYPRLHTNACGDFTLLSRDAWFALQGYAELDMYSMHLDSVLCHAAHRAGYTEYLLGGPMQIYHIEHGLGSGWTPEGSALLNQRLARAGIPQLSFEQLVAWAQQMRRTGLPMPFNDANWGLAQEHLPETVLGADRPAVLRTWPALAQVG